MKDRFKFRFWNGRKMIYDDLPQLELYNCENYKWMQSTGLKDKKGELIYEADIIVVPNLYPFYDYKNKEEYQDLNKTNSEIKGETILNYIGIVEWIHSKWQYVYHCVNSDKRGISEGINNGLNDYGYDENENTEYLILGNIYENKELLDERN